MRSSIVCTIVRPVSLNRSSIHFERPQLRQCEFCLLFRPSYCSHPPYCVKMATRQLRSKGQRLSFYQFFSIRFESLLAAFSTLFASAKEQQTISAALSLQQTFPVLTEAMVQTRTSPFKAYDLRRNKLHTVDGSGGRPAPRKTSIHRLTRSDWATPKVTKASRKSPRKSTKKTVKAASSLTAANLLRCEDEETSCLHCDRWADDPKCTFKCYAAFRKEHDAEQLIVRTHAYQCLQ